MPDGSAPTSGQLCDLRPLVRLSWQLAAGAGAAWTHASRKGTSDCQQDPARGACSPSVPGQGISHGGGRIHLPVSGLWGGSPQQKHLLTQKLLEIDGHEFRDPLKLPQPRHHLVSPQILAGSSSTPGTLSGCWGYSNEQDEVGLVTRCLPSRKEDSYKEVGQSNGGG